MVEIRARHGVLVEWSVGFDAVIGIKFPFKGGRDVARAVGLEGMSSLCGTTYNLSSSIYAVGWQQQMVQSGNKREGLSVGVSFSW